MFIHFPKPLAGLFYLSCVGLLHLSVGAQIVPTTKPVTGYAAPKWDIFAGYSYLSPNTSVTLIPTGSETSTSESTTVGYHNVNLGGDISGAYFFNRYVGAQVELGVHEWGMQKGDVWVSTGTRGNNDGFTTIAGGIMLRYPTERLAPFAHVLFGGALVDGPAHSPFTWSPATTVGGGLDLETSWWKHRIAIRVIQADYEYIHTDFSSWGVYVPQKVSINATRFSTGIVFHPGWIPFPPVTVSCTANPNLAFPGDPVAVTSVASNLNPKLNALYTWSGNGVTGSGTTAAVATADLAPGSYTVNCGVKEGKTGKEGLKPGESAESMAHFTLKPFEPPTMSCSANPGTIKPGEISTITAVGISPQNRPLTYTYSTAAGTIGGNGTTAEFKSAGAPAGPVGITCKATDDKGHTATANTSVTILLPPPPPVPHVTALCSLGFSSDKTRPTRVNNQAKACLDEVALTLQKQPDAKVVVVGHEDLNELAREEKLTKRGRHVKAQGLAAERAVNAKAYLVMEKGIDASRVSVTTSHVEGQTAEDYLIPSGANFFADVPNTTAVDETTVKPIERKPLAQSSLKRAHKKAEAPTASK